MNVDKRIKEGGQKVRAEPKEQKNSHQTGKLKYILTKSVSFVPSRQCGVPEVRLQVGGGGSSSPRSGAILPPGDAWQCEETALVVTDGRWVLLASSEQKSEML